MTRRHDMTMRRRHARSGCWCCKKWSTSAATTILLSALVFVSTVVSLCLHRFAPDIDVVVDDRIVANRPNNKSVEHDLVESSNHELLRQRLEETELRLDRLQQLSQRRVREAKLAGAPAGNQHPPLLQLRTYPPHVQELRDKWMRRKEQEELLKRQRGNFPTYNLSSFQATLLQIFNDPSTSTCGGGGDEGGPPQPGLRGRNGTLSVITNRTRQEDVGVCVRDVLEPPFGFSMPRFIGGTDHETWFFVQPENRAALLTNFTDWSYKTCVKIPRRRDRDATRRLGRPKGCVVGRIEAHDVWSFQHFHDIGLPLAMQHRQLFDSIQRAQALAGCEPYAVHLTYDPPQNSKVLKEEWSRIGFPINQSLSYGEIDDVCGGNVVTTTIVKGMSAHPSHVRELRNRLFPDSMPLSRRKVVWISRSHGPNADSQMVWQRRQVSNEPEVMELLRTTLTGFEVLNPMLDEVDTVADIRRRLGDACLILGVHGGQMYNQFFAGTQTAVLELMPVSDDPDKRGWYHGQSSPSSKPVLAHRSIWFNANLIGQPYWRIYVASPSVNSFNLTQEVVDQILQVVTATGCT